MKQSFGNGDTKFKISTLDMGGWVRTWLEEGHPKDLPCYLSHALTAFFRERPQLRLRFIVPYVKDGETVELHAWYDQVQFRDLSHLAEPKKPKS